MLEEYSREDRQFLKAVENIAYSHCKMVEAFEKMAVAFEKIAENMTKNNSCQTEKEEQKQEEIKNEYWQCQDCGKKFDPEESRLKQCDACGSPAIFPSYESEYVMF